MQTEISNSNNMGSVFEKEQKSANRQHRCVRSKGDRLGWTPFNEVVHVPLRERKGEIRVLTDENMYRIKGARVLL